MTSSGGNPRFDLVLKGGRVIDERNKIDGIFDVGIAGGKSKGRASSR